MSTTGTTHLTQGALLRLSGALRQQEANRLAQVYSDGRIWVFHQTQQGADHQPGVGVFIKQVHVEAKMRQSFQESLEEEGKDAVIKYSNADILEGGKFANGPKYLV